ncbi:DUF1565 domain-containing protein [bacterium]|nr:DUF1565 domain-containing protein [bacterium]
MIYGDRLNKYFSIIGFLFFLVFMVSCGNNRGVEQPTLTVVDSSATLTRTDIPVSTTESFPILTIGPTESSADANAFFVAVDGRDDGPGTKDAPWQTIQYAVEHLPGGAVVNILEGEYDERVVLENNGLSLLAVGKVVLKGFEISGNENSISGFSITDPSSEVGIWITGDYNLISGNEIFHMGQDGIWFFGDGNVISGNIIHDILSPSAKGDPHSDCFQTWGPATNITLYGNICLHTRSSGSNQIAMVEAMDGPVSHLVFMNNIFVMDDPGYSPLNLHRKTGQPPITDIMIVNNNFIHRNGIGQYGVQFIGVERATILNNVFVDYGMAYNPYINILGSSDIVIDYNAVYKSDGVPPQDGPYPHDLWMVDPGFVDADNLNFQLQPDSPLIDAGVLIQAVTEDFNGLVRPQNNIIDIGAIEFSQN